MLVIGVAEIMLIAFIAIGGMLLAMRLVGNQRGGKTPGAVKNNSGEFASNQTGGVDYDHIRRRVERRWKRRSELATHGAVYVFTGVGFAVTRFPAIVPVMLIWGAILFIHLLQVFFAEARERAIEQEVEKERQRVGANPPPHRTVRLSDEGELLDVVEDDWDTDQKQKRS